MADSHNPEEVSLKFNDQESLRVSPKLLSQHSKFFGKMFDPAWEKRRARDDGGFLIELVDNSETFGCIMAALRIGTAEAVSPFLFQFNFLEVV
jgi:hypothetical protein